MLHAAKQINKCDLEIRRRQCVKFGWNELFYCHDISGFNRQAPHKYREHWSFFIGIGGGLAFDRLILSFFPHSATSLVEGGKMSELIPFDFEGNAVRVVEREGEPWFVLADVCRVLDLSNPSMAARGLDDDEVTLNQIKGSHRPTNLINESGLYALIVRSDKPNAKPFRKWVTAEVLPALRRTGRYDMACAPAPEQPADLRVYIDLVREARFTFGRAAGSSADLPSHAVLNFPLVGLSPTFWTSGHRGVRYSGHLGRRNGRGGRRSRVSAGRVFQHPVYRRPANPQPLGNGGSTQALATFGSRPMQTADLLCVDAGLAALVHPGGLGLGDAFGLAFLPEVRLEFSEHTQHVQEGFACGGAGVHGLLSAGQGGALGADRLHDGLQVRDGAGEPVNARHHQHVTGTKELQHGSEFGAALGRGAAGLLFAHDLTPGGAEGFNLDGGVLVGAADAGVSDAGHDGLQSSRLGLDHSLISSRNAEVNPNKTRNASHLGALVRYTQTRRVGALAMATLYLTEGTNTVGTHSAAHVFMAADWVGVTDAGALTLAIIEGQCCRRIGGASLVAVAASGLASRPSFLPGLPSSRVLSAAAGEASPPNLKRPAPPPPHKSVSGFLEASRRNSAVERERVRVWAWDRGMGNPHPVREVGR